jgi:hypothetical protein
MREMPPTSRRKTSSRKPTHAARARAFAAALGATGRRRRRVARAAAAADGIGKEEAALEIGRQQVALEDAQRFLLERRNSTLDPEAKAVINDQIAQLGAAIGKLGAQRIRAAFDADNVKKALRRLAEITGNLQNEAKVLKTATDLVARVAKVLGFVEQGLMVLTSAGLLAA